MRYKTIAEPSPSVYNLAVGDRWIHPETGQESDWNGTAWGSTPEADPVTSEGAEDTDGDGEPEPPAPKVAAPPVKPAAVKPKAATTKK